MLSGFSKFVHSIRIDFLGKNKLSGPVRKAQKDLNRLKHSFDSVRAAGRKAMMIGMLMMAPLLIGAKAYGNFEEATLKFQTVVQSTMGGVAQSMEYAQKRAREFGRSHVQSAKDFMTTAYMMASAGLKDVAAIEATDTAMKVATATMGDHVSAANMLAVIYNNMGNKLKKPAVEMKRLGDIVTATQQTFQFENLAAVTEGFKYAASAAIENQWPLEELMTTIGQLNNVGLQGTMAGTALAMTLAKIIPASKKLGFEIARDSKGNLQYIQTLRNISEVLGPMNKWTNETRFSIQKAFGQRGKRAITTLIPHIETLAKNFERIRDSAGITEKTVEIMESGFNPQLKIMKNLMTDIAISIGDIGFAGMMKRMNGVLKSISEFLEAHPKFTKFISILGLTISSVVVLAGMFMWLFGAIGGNIIKFKILMNVSTGFAKAIGVLKTGVIGLGRAFLGLFLNPVGLVILAVVALGIALVVLYKKSEKFRNFINGIGASLKKFFLPMLDDVAYGLGYLCGTFYGAWLLIKTYTEEIWPAIRKIMKDEINGMMLDLGLPAGTWGAAWEGVKVLFVAAWDTMANTMGKKIKTMINDIRTVLTLMGGVVKVLIQLAAGDFEGALETIIETGASMKERFLRNLEIKEEHFNKQQKIFKKAGKGLATAFGEGMNLGWGDMEGGIVGLFNKILPYLTGSDAKKGPLSNITGSGAGFVKAFSSGMKEESPGLVEATKETFARIAPIPQGVQPAVGSAPVGRGEIKIVFEDGAIRIISETMEMGADRLKEKLTRIFQEINQEYGGLSIESA